MNRQYFTEVARQTPTRVWVNNPTGTELHKAVAAGAIAGTTNPAYGSKLLRKEPGYILPMIDKVVAETDDDDEAADLIYQSISKRFMDGFLPLYTSTGGTAGFVTMQDEPRRDHKAELIVAAAHRHARVAPNYMAKIPVTETGMKAMAALVREGMAVCATECFSISQAVGMCKVYVQACGDSGKRPPFFITHITGIFDEEMAHQVKQSGIDISADVLGQAGTIVARRQYRVLREQGYNVPMLGGGARVLQHFTEWVGGAAHITLNWSTMEELMRSNPPIEDRMNSVDDPRVVEELRSKLPDFRRAYDDNGLDPAEFEQFAPLIRFRNNFIEGCDAVLRAVAARREPAGAK